MSPTLETPPLPLPPDNPDGGLFVVPANNEPANNEPANNEPETELQVEAAVRSLLQSTEALLEEVPAEPAPHDWLTKEQAAERLRTTERTIARWISERRISTRKSAPRPGKKPQAMCDPVDIERLQGEMAKAAVLPPDTSQQRNSVEMAVINRIPQMVAQLAHAIGSAQTGTVPPFLDLDAASRYTSLPRRLLLSMIRDHRLAALSWNKEFYVKKRDLDNLDIRP